MMGGAGQPLKSARICGFRLGVGVGGTAEAMAELTEGIVGKLEALAPALPEVLQDGGHMRLTQRGSRASDRAGRVRHVPEPFGGEVLEGRARAVQA